MANHVNISQYMHFLATQNAAKVLILSHNALSLNVMKFVEH